MYSKLLLISLASVALSGCMIHIGSGDGDSSHSSWQNRQLENRKYIAQLARNEKKDAVLSVLGAPDFSESISKDGKRITVLFYRTHRVDSDGQTSKDETTPLIFVNEQLDSWGHSAYNLLTNA